MRLETTERKENVYKRELTDITERRMQCVSTITSTSERLKCLFCQKVPRLINYSGIGGRIQEKALPLQERKWHEPCFTTPRSYAPQTGSNENIYVLKMVT